MNISFTVEGHPRGKARPRFARRGKFVSVRSDPKDINYAERVKYAFLQERTKDKTWQMPSSETPLSVIIICYYACPKSWSKKRKEATAYAYVKPDADNIAKIICDSLNKLAWPDDSQVVELYVLKYRCETRYQERVFVRITDWISNLHQ
jgi:Holliday junction resolvase RusA-like endonuclease